MKMRFTDEHMIGIQKEADVGVGVAELCRKYGISDATFYNWKTKSGGMTVSEELRLKALQVENNKLKRLLAEAMLDNAALKDVVGRKRYPRKPGVQRYRT
jgi:putative transposase